MVSSKGLNDIGRLLDALIAIGFDDVYEAARGAEYVSREIAQRVRDRKVHNGMPLISSACPAIVRLIQGAVPGAAGQCGGCDLAHGSGCDCSKKARLPQHERFARRRGHLLSIALLPAKMTEVRAPESLRKSNVDGVISIMDVYGMLNSELKRARQLRGFCSTPEPTAWAGRRPAAR